jgi:hypothetical protein
VTQGRKSDLSRLVALRASDRFLKLHIARLIRPSSTARRKLKRRPLPEHLPRENTLESYYESDEKYRLNKAKRHDINRSPHMTRGRSLSKIHHIPNRCSIKNRVQRTQNRQYRHLLRPNKATQYMSCKTIQLQGATYEDDSDCAAKAMLQLLRIIRSSLRWNPASLVVFSKCSATRVPIVSAFLLQQARHTTLHIFPLTRHIELSVDLMKSRPVLTDPQRQTQCHRKVRSRMFLDII